MACENTRSQAIVIGTMDKMTMDMDFLAKMALYQIGSFALAASVTPLSRREI